MNNTFSRNIKFLRKRRKRTQGDVAFALNMKRSTLSGYENEISAPSLDNLIALSDYYQIPVDTLLRIDLTNISESQLKSIENSFEDYIKGRYLRILSTTIDSENDENIELVPEKAKAGYTRGFADPEFISALPVFKLPFLSKERKYRTFQITGDSMLPIPDGAYITGEFVQDWNEVKNNRAYIFLTKDDGLVFKIAENNLKEERAFTLYSMNPFYDPFKLHINEISEIWKFTHFISEELPEPRLPKDDLITAVANLKFDINKIKEKLAVQ